MRRWVGALLLAVVLPIAIAAIPAWAQTDTGMAATTVVELEKPVALEPLRWLPPGSDIAAALATLPARRLRSVESGGRLSLNAALGELAFTTPQIFGGPARKSGLSCQTCHPNGHLNAAFFVPGLSRQPGNVDVTGGLFNPAVDDHILNDLNIPSLRGVAQTAPYGHDGRIHSLRAFTRHVIVEEFRGAEPAPWLLDALVAYQREFAFLPPVDDGAVDPAAVARGERLFHRPFPQRPQTSCASCHPADAAFTDRRLHDVGTGGLFDTPSLRNLTATAPYLHDGSAADLHAAVDHFNRHFGLALGPKDLADLVAYLGVVGSAAGTPVRPGLESDVTLFARQLDLVAEAIERDDAERQDYIVRALRHRLGEIHARLPGDDLTTERAVLIDWSRRLSGIAERQSRGDDVGARGELSRLRDNLDRRRSLLSKAADRSLYDPDRLRQRFSE